MFMRCSLYFPHCRLDFGYAHRVTISILIMLVQIPLRDRPISGPIDSRDVIYLISPSFTSSRNSLCNRRRAGPELSPSHTDDSQTFIRMCGIIAVFESQPTSRGKPDELSSQIQDSLGYIAHRGPDASAVWVNEDASCGRSLYRGKKELNDRAGTLPTCDQRSNARRGTTSTLPRRSRSRSSKRRDLRLRHHPG